MEYKILTVNEFKDRIDEFCDLYQLCFSGKISNEAVKWRYIDSPYNDLLVAVAIDNGKIVANNAASPFEIVQNGVVYKAALSINTMTHPKYRGMGLFVKLAKELYKHMDEKGYRCVIGFPNYISNPILVSKLGRIVIYEIPTLELRLSQFKSNLFDTSDVKEDDAFLYEYLQWNHCNKGIYIKKTVEYFRWRYYNNPERVYKNFVLTNSNQEVRSYIICKEYNEKINIVDFGTSSINDLNILIGRVIEYALALSKESVTAWSQIGTEEHIVFEKIGFRNNYPITYFSTKVFKCDENAKQFYDYRNWFIQPGDDNVY